MEFVFTTLSASSRGLLGCDAVWCGGSIPTFWRTLLLPSSGRSEPFRHSTEILLHD